MFLNGLLIPLVRFGRTVRVIIYYILDVRFNPIRSWGMEVVSRTFTAFDDWSLSQTPVGNCRTKSWLLEKASGYWQPIWLGLKRNYFIIKYLAIFFYLLACSLKNVVKNPNSFYLVYNIALHSIYTWPILAIFHLKIIFQIHIKKGLILISWQSGKWWRVKNYIYLVVVVWMREEKIC